MIIDVTRPVRVGVPVWPGDPEFATAWTMRRERGDPANAAELRMGTHTGTHADAPFHVRDAGATIGALDLERFIGPARVVDLGGATLVDVDLLERRCGSPLPERILFRTGCWAGASGFPARWPAIDPRAAGMLVAAGVRLVGTDAPSVDPERSTQLESHHLFAAAGIPILENLALEEAPPGEYELIALPLRLVEADASPVRAMLRPR